MTDRDRINDAIHRETEPLHAEIAQLRAELDRMRNGSHRDTPIAAPTDAPEAWERALASAHAEIARLTTEAGRAVRGEANALVAAEMLRTEMEDKLKARDTEIARLKARIKRLRTKPRAKEVA